MTVVNMHVDEYDVRIDRKTKWGNPFVIGRDGTRLQVIDKYKTKLWRDIKTGRVDLTELAGLHGKRLGCWCAPAACHGDVLVAAAEWAWRAADWPGEFA